MSLLHGDLELASVAAEDEVVRVSVWDQRSNRVKCMG